MVKEKRQAADGQTIYAASKVFAERSIMDFVIEHRGEIGWDAVRFVPAFVGVLFTELPKHDSDYFISRIDIRSK